ncbi:MAG TPA: hypothetical protein VF160_06580 [Candidatus Dormibacteraeota bacterium]
MQTKNTPYRYDIEVLRRVAVQTVDLTKILLLTSQNDHTEAGSMLWGTARWLYINANLNLQAVADLVGSYDAALAEGLRSVDEVEPMIVTSAPRADGLLDVRMVLPRELGLGFMDAVQAAIKPKRRPRSKRAEA